MDKKIDVNIFSGIRQELIKIDWPTKKEALHLTLVVVIISFLLAAYIGILDSLFAKLLKVLINLKP